MRITEERTYKRDVVVKCFCDKCGKEIEDIKDYILYDNIKVHFDYSAWGDNWTDWGFEIEDLCLECCKDLEQLLKDNGYKLKDLT